MSNTITKLENDLEILAAMASEMEVYLDSDVLFWHMSKPRMPALTLGGYLMRQHRLLALQDLLSSAEQGTLDQAVMQYHGVLVERIVRLEQKAHREIDARMRQWSEFLNDVSRGTANSISYYRTAVEARAMLSALQDQLLMAPYELEERVTRELALLDSQLRRKWVSGEFVWPELWQPAYPTGPFWWLYGHVREVGAP